MTVAELQKALEGVDPDCQVLLLACDHRYREADAAFNIDACYSSEYQEWTAYYDEYNRTEWEDELHKVLVIQ